MTEEESEVTAKEKAQRLSGEPREMVIYRANNGMLQSISTVSRLSPWAIIMLDLGFQSWGSRMHLIIDSWGSGADNWLTKQIYGIKTCCFELAGKRRPEGDTNFAWRQPSGSRSVIRAV